MKTVAQAQITSVRKSNAPHHVEAPDDTFVHRAVGDGGAVYAEFYSKTRVPVGTIIYFNTGV